LELQEGKAFWFADLFSNFLQTVLLLVAQEKLWSLSTLERVLVLLAALASPRSSKAQQSLDFVEMTRNFSKM
jgi:hypothetical protein